MAHKSLVYSVVGAVGLSLIAMLIGIPVLAVVGYVLGAIVTALHIVLIH